MAVVSVYIMSEQDTSSTRVVYLILSNPSASSSSHVKVSSSHTLIQRDRTLVTSDGPETDPRYRGRRVQIPDHE